MPRTDGFEGAERGMFVRSYAIGTDIKILAHLATPCTEYYKLQHCLLSQPDLTRTEFFPFRFRNPHPCRIGERVVRTHRTSRTRTGGTCGQQIKLIRPVCGATVFDARLIGQILEPAR